MSEVISFRLDHKNPRESRAHKILIVWHAEGYSTRHFITEALLKLEDPSDPYATIAQEELHETLSQFCHLLEQIGNRDYIPAVRQEKGSSHPGLTSTFIASAKKVVRTGLKLD